MEKVAIKKRQMTVYMTDTEMATVRMAAMIDRRSMTQLILKSVLREAEKIINENSSSSNHNQCPMDSTDGDLVFPELDN